MYFVPHFGHAEVYETSIWTPCQALTLTQNGTRPRRTSNNKDLLVLRKCCWSYKFFFNIKSKNIAQTTLILIYFIFIYFKNIWDILEGKFVNKNAPKCSPALYLGPVEVFFYCLKPFRGFFTGLGP